MNKNYTFTDHPYNDIERIPENGDDSSFFLVETTETIKTEGYHSVHHFTMTIPYSEFKEAYLSGKNIVIHENYSPEGNYGEYDYYIVGIMMVYDDYEDAELNFYKCSIYTSLDSFYFMSDDAYPTTDYNDA